MSRSVYIGLGIIGSVGAATWYFLTRAPGTSSNDVGTDINTDNGSGPGVDDSILDEVTVETKKIAGAQWPYPRGSEYENTFDAVSQQYGIPPGLLARVGWQESRFRADIIDGTTVSGAGAIGIMQFVPRWHPDLNPYDPIASINYAGRYLSGLHDKFGTWDLALAAYNWGEGNISKHSDPSTWPKETRDYVAQISADVSTGEVA